MRAHCELSLSIVERHHHRGTTLAHLIDIISSSHRMQPKLLNVPLTFEMSAEGIATYAKILSTAKGGTLIELVRYHMMHLREMSVDLLLARQSSIALGLRTQAGKNVKLQVSPKVFISCKMALTALIWAEMTDVVLRRSVIGGCSARRQSLYKFRSCA